MSKEYEKMRQKIAKKYKDEIADVRAENKLLRTELEEMKSEVSELDNIKRNYIKLLMYCNLSEEEKAELFADIRINERLESITSSYGNVLKSPLWQSVFKQTSDIIRGSKSLKDILNDEGS